MYMYMYKCHVGARVLQQIDNRRTHQQLTVHITSQHYLNDPSTHMCVGTYLESRYRRGSSSR